MIEGLNNFKKFDESYCLREKNMATWFFFIMGIWFIILAANIESGFSRQRYLPLHSICECLPEGTGINPMKPDYLE
jgi:hypothetical protein